MLYVFELLVWLMFGVLFIVCGASLVALASALFSSKKRLDRHQVGWLLVGMLASAALMWFYVTHLVTEFSFAACFSFTVGVIVGACVWTKFIEDGLELPHNETEIFRS